MKNTRRTTVKPPAAGPKKDRKSRRNVVVLASLLGSLTLTSMLLLVMAPAPLIPDASLVAVDDQRPDGFETVFNTLRVPLQSGRWQYVYVHHSNSRRGSATAIEAAGTGAHFVIGNGDGSADGQIEMGHRWVNQQAAAIAGSNVPANCVTVCLVGDLNAKAPTSKQLDSLRQLTRAVQRRLQLSRKAILLDAQRGDPAGAGRKFPAAQFLSAVLP